MLDFLFIKVTKSNGSSPHFTPNTRFAFVKRLFQTLLHSPTSNSFSFIFVYYFIAGFYKLSDLSLVSFVLPHLYICTTDRTKEIKEKYGKKKGKKATFNSWL